MANEADKQTCQTSDGEEKLRGYLSCKEKKKNHVFKAEILRVNAFPPALADGVRCKVCNLRLTSPTSHHNQPFLSSAAPLNSINFIANIIARAHFFPAVLAVPLCFRMQCDIFVPHDSLIQA